jgi:hypothetical protein
MTMVAEDRYKRSHCQENARNSAIYSDFGIITVVQYLVDLPFSRAVQIRLTQAFAQSLAISHHLGCQGRTAGSGRRQDTD